MKEFLVNFPVAYHLPLLADQTFQFVGVYQVTDLEGLLAVYETVTWQKPKDASAITYSIFLIAHMSLLQTKITFLQMYEGLLKVSVTGVEIQRRLTQETIYLAHKMCFLSTTFPRE